MVSLAKALRLLRNNHKRLPAPACSAAAEHIRSLALPLPSLFCPPGFLYNRSRALRRTVMSSTTSFEPASNGFAAPEIAQPRARKPEHAQLLRAVTEDAIPSGLSRQAACPPVSE